MIVDFILKARIARSIRAGLALQDDRTPIGQDEAGPDEQDARLSEGDLTVVAAD
jgi:hypothetical protein